VERKALKAESRLGGRRLRKSQMYNAADSTVQLIEYRIKCVDICEWYAVLLMDAAVANANVLPRAVHLR
jgi:hypothetical protein